MNLDKQLALNENKFYMFTMDCQAVKLCKLCPTLQDSALYYSKKLNTHYDPLQYGNRALQKLLVA